MSTRSTDTSHASQAVRLLLRHIISRTTG